MTQVLTPYLVLQLRQTLRVKCFGCQRDAVVDVVSLIDRGLGDKPTSEFRFRCTGCGGKDVNPRLDRYGP